MFEKLREIIESYNSIVIYGHPNPDGDCYGSQLALREGIKLNYPNKKVYATGTGLRRFRTCPCGRNIHGRGLLLNLTRWE